LKEEIKHVRIENQRLTHAADFLDTQLYRKREEVENALRETAEMYGGHVTNSDPTVPLTFRLRQALGNIAMGNPALMIGYNQPHPDDQQANWHVPVINRDTMEPLSPGMPNLRPESVGSLPPPMEEGSNNFDGEMAGEDEDYHGDDVNQADQVMNTTMPRGTPHQQDLPFVSVQGSSRIEVTPNNAPVPSISRAPKAPGANKRVAQKDKPKKISRPKKVKEVAKEKKRTLKAAAASKLIKAKKTTVARKNRQISAKAVVAATVNGNEPAQSADRDIPSPPVLEDQSNLAVVVSPSAIPKPAKKTATKVGTSSNRRNDVLQELNLVDPTTLVYEDMAEPFLKKTYFKSILFYRCRICEKYFSTQNGASHAKKHSGASTPRKY
jgi:hypothetical protein